MDKIFHFFNFDVGAFIDSMFEILLYLVGFFGTFGFLLLPKNNSEIKTQKLEDDFEN